MGGAGIPVPIEEAIVTRATDRLTCEYQRESAEVWDEMARKGLTLPSGALVSGRKAARARSPKVSRRWPPMSRSRTSNSNTTT
jgi:hypothetical protein